MNYNLVAKEIIRNVGGIENLEHVTNCATRLRLTIIDKSKVEIENIQKINGVIDAIYKSGQLQIIIGVEVAKVCNEVKAIIGGNTNNSNNKVEKSEKGNIVSRFLDVLTGVFAPILPVITAAGMIQAVLAVLLVFNIVSKESQTYYVLKFVGDAGFYFLPIYLAFSSAQKFKCNPFLATMVGGILLHPNLGALVSAGEPVKFVGITLPLVKYGASVIPIILTVYIMSFIEEFADRVSPKAIKVILKPLIIVLIMAPVALLVTGPIGSYIGNGLSFVINTLNTKVSWLVPMLMGGFAPWLIMMGAHHGLTPLVAQSMASFGYEKIMGPGFLAGNISQGAAALAVSFKTKNKELKQLAGSAGVTALLGITEPALYGVNSKLKKPLICSMIGGASGGLFAGITGLGRYALGAPSLVTLPTFIGEDPRNLINAVITVVIAFTVTFVATLLIGVEENVIEEFDENKVVNM